MKKRNYGIILVLILLIGVGYAYLSTTLTINGTANFKKNDWSIIWDIATLSVKNDSVSTEAEGYYAPRYAVVEGNTDKTTIEYRAPLQLPGDIYHFTIDMYNNGSIDAMITENGVHELVDELLPAEKKYIIYWVKYTDGNEIKPYDGLKAEGRRNVEVFVKYRDDVAAGDLPDENNERVLQSKFDFVQADSHANYVRVAATGDSTGVANANATQISAPVVEGVTVLPNAKFTTDEGTYTVTVTYTNSGSKAVKFKNISSTGLNTGVNVAVTDSEGAALVADTTTIAASGTLVVKYVFSVESGTTIPEGGLLINAANATASVEINFAE